MYINTWQRQTQENRHNTVGTYVVKLTKFPGSIIIKIKNKKRLINSIGAHQWQTFLKGSCKILLIETVCECDTYTNKRMQSFAYCYKNKEQGTEQ